MIALLLAAIVLGAPLGVLAATNQDLADTGAVGADELAANLGLPDRTEGIGEAPCELSPANPGEITKQNAEKLTVTIGEAVFTFDHAFWHDRTGGSESTSFIFTPKVDGKRLDAPAFVYRTGPRESDNGFMVGVRGDGSPSTANGYALDDIMVAGRCEGFNDSAFAKALDKVAGEDNLEDLNVTGQAKLTENTSAFSGGDDSDPFAVAITKMSEVVNALNSSLVSALSSVMDMGNITEVKGLTKAWSTIRDLVNLLFALVLAVLAVLTIVRVDVRNYNVRQSLPLLVFAVVAVNYGLLLAEILLNSAYVLAQPFMMKSQTIVQAVAVGGPSADAGDVGFGTAVVLLFASLITLLGLIILLFFFIVRIIVVWLLAALSPVIFLFMVLPLTRGEAKNLVSTWIKWVYMAPIAFLILYIGAAMLQPTFGSNSVDDSGASAILSAIFYAGVLAAAVLIPYGLGGRVMAMAGSRGLSAAGVGARGGIGAAALLPTGGGRTVGQRVRTGKALLKGRQDSLEQDAQYDAANLRLMAANKGLGGLAGLSDGQQIALQEQMVQAREKEMMPLDSSAKMRIAHGWQYGTESDAAGNVYALGADGTRFGGANAKSMTDKELSLTKDRFAAAAAYKTLASSDISEPYMVEKPGVGNRTFAWTGYQQQHRGNPMIGAYDLNGRFNEGKMKIIAQTMGGDDLKGLDTEVFTNGISAAASPEERRRSIEFFRNVDASRLSQAANSDHRDKFSTEVKRNEMARIAHRGLLSHGLSAEEGKQQREKERMIVEAWKHGQRKIGRTDSEINAILNRS